MAKIYLAGPMRNIPEFNFPAFNAAAAKLRAEGHEVYNPAEEEPGKSYREYLAADLAWICAEAEAIALLPGWEGSSGARAEFVTAHALGLKFICLCTQEITMDVVDYQILVDLLIHHLDKRQKFIMELLHEIARPRQPDTVTTLEPATPDGGW